MTPSSSVVGFIFVRAVDDDISRLWLSGAGVPRILAATKSLISACAVEVSFVPEVCGSDDDFVLLSFSVCLIGSAEYLVLLGCCEVESDADFVLFGVGVVPLDPSISSSELLSEICRSAKKLFTNEKLSRGREDEDGAR